MTLVNPLDLQTVIQPRTLAEALAHLERRDVTVYPVAGGTTLLAGTAPGVEVVLDLSQLGLRYVRREGQALHIGATSTLHDLAEDATLREVADGLLSIAARTVAPSVQRHQQTVGGALAAGHPNDDVLVALLALDAQVVCYFPERRDTPDVFPADEFLARVRGRTPYLITEVRILLPEGRLRGSLQRVSRTPRSASIVSVAVTAAEGGPVRVAAGGVAEVPVRLSEVERFLQGKTREEVSLVEVEQRAREQVSPADDWQASGEYRRHMVGVLVRRALAAVLEG